MNLQQAGLAVAAVLLVSGTAAAQDEENTQLRAELYANAQEALEELFNTVEGSRGLFNDAEGYAVFETTKAGFIVTGGGGRGVAIDKSSGKTVYMKVGMGGIGFAIGAQQFDMVILFDSASRLETFIDGGWGGSAAAQAMAGGDSADASQMLQDGVVVYTLTSAGLMASADISAARFWVDEDLN
jgi:lipid-binding SYLF domain-containing protein